MINRVYKIGFMFLVLVMVVTLISTGSYADSDILRISLNKAQIIGTETQDVGIVISKPSFGTLIDTDLTLQINGPAYFIHNQGKTVQKSYSELGEEVIENYKILLEESYSGDRSEVTVIASLKYSTREKRFKVVGEDIITGPTTDIEQASFTGVWTDVAIVKTELEKCQGNLNTCQQENKVSNEKIQQQTTQSLELEAANSVLTASNQSLKNFRTYFYIALVVAIILAFVLVVRLRQE